MGKAVIAHEKARHESCMNGTDSGCMDFDRHKESTFSSNHRKEMVLGKWAGFASVELVERHPSVK